MSSVMLDTCRIQEINFSINVKQRLEFCRIERSKQKKSKNSQFACKKDACFANNNLANS